jgi:hypothetical protein
MMTSDMTKRGRQAREASTVSAKLVVPKSTINGPTAKAMLAISKENLREFLQLRVI